MKNPLFFLRFIGLFLLALSASSVQAKGCTGILSITIQYADGTQALLAESNESDFYAIHDLSVSLSPGDTILVHYPRHGLCSGSGGIRVSGTMWGDTADLYSPVVHYYGSGATIGPVFKIAQRGSFYVQQFGTDNGVAFRLFIDAIQEPVAVGLRFRQSYNPIAIVAAGDTCTTPCVSIYLTDGESLQMQPVSGDMAQPGGNVVVRHAAEGEPLGFGSPSTVVSLVDFEGYQFSEDGNYLLYVEGPFFTSSAVAWAHISHLPTPRVDMSLFIERANGSSEEVAYIQPGGSSSMLHIDLDPGDSLRIEHHEITEPCSSVRLLTYAGPGWAPAWQGELISDRPSTTAGIRMAMPGSYRLKYVSDCGIPAAGQYLTINAPTPQLDLVVSVRHSDGLENELFRSHVPIDPPPHLEAQLDLGDSLRVSYEHTGYCGPNMTTRIYKSGGSEDATVADMLLNYGRLYEPEFLFRGSANYLISLSAQSCYSDQRVYLQITPTPIPAIDLQVDQLLSDGTALPLMYAEAGEPTAFADVELEVGDSIRVHSLVEQAACTGLVLKVYRAETDTATTLDPVFMDSPLDSSGLSFRETGSLLLTLEDTCGAITASAHLSVSTALTTGISTRTENGFNARYANDLLTVDAVTGGLLQVRNMAGQLVHEAELAKGILHHTIPFSGEAGGVYIATLLGAAHVDVMRFAVY